MMKETRDAVAALLRLDPSITPETVKAGIAVLDGKATNALDAAPLDRVLSRAEVARLLGVTPRSVTSYARRGLIRPCRFGLGGKRSVGFSADSVRAAMAGRGI